MFLVCMCVGIHAHVHACVHMNVEAQGCLWESSLIALHFIELSVELRVLHVH